MKKKLDNLTNNELDNILRNALDKYDIPYQEDDWKKMQSKLDAPPPTGLGKSAGLAKYMLFLGGVTVLLLSIWWWVKSPGEISNSDQYNIATVTQKQNTPKESSGTSASDNTDRQHDNDSPNIDYQNTLEKNQKQLPNGLLSTISGQKEQQSTGLPITTTLTKPDIKAFMDLDTKFNSIMEKSAVQIPEKEVELAQDTKVKKPVDYARFSTTLILSPDVSAVNILDIHGVGSNIGVNFEYFVREKISINAGLLYAFKTYKADYQTNTGGYQPSTNAIRGDCYILDIPIAVRYYLNSHESLQRWYISSGLSSYLMLTEKYQIEPEMNSGVPPYSNRVDNKNNHYLGVLNLSAGYQRQLTEKLAIQIEPYVKLPITGVGEYNVNLKSTGIWIGMKYNW
ncbi:outer membrane beta-barrel protein [Belliella marina]|uniref:Outer membrane beta-barrel protein n=1 Tax=Belliella marina TaxID=1644146 RepID=A0ABW4VVI0_9BACT